MDETEALAGDKVRCWAVEMKSSQMLNCYIVTPLGVCSTARTGKRWFRASIDCRSNFNGSLDWMQKYFNTQEWMGGFKHSKDIGFIDLPTELVKEAFNRTTDRERVEQCVNELAALCWKRPVGR